MSERNKNQESEEADVAWLVYLVSPQAEGESISCDLSPSSSLRSVSLRGGAAFLRGVRLGVAFLGEAGSLVSRRLDFQHVSVVPRLQGLFLTLPSFSWNVRMSMSNFFLNWVNLLTAEPTFLKPIA